MGAYSELILGEPLLRSYLKMKETAGTAATDVGPAGLAGVYSGGFTLAQPSLLVADPLEQDLASVLFNGTTAKLSLGDNYDFVGNAPFTVEVWAKPTTVDATVRRVFSKEQFVATRTGWFVANDGNLKLRRYTGSGSGTNDAAGPIGAVVGNVCHLAGAYDGQSLRMYVNGQPGVAAAAAASNPDSAVALAIGTDAGGNGLGFAGNLAHAAIYNGALSAAAVLKHYLAGTETPEARRLVRVAAGVEEPAGQVVRLRSPAPASGGSFAYRGGNQTFSIDQEQRGSMVATSDPEVIAGLRGLGFTLV